jgi:glycosyltransferase involved in cell wall biosynthesis
MSNIKNIAQVVEDLKIGGLERVIENITMHLDPEKFRVFVLCLSKGGEIAERLITNRKYVEILGIKNYHSPLSLLKVTRWFREKGIKIAHTHAYPAGVLGRVAAIMARVPCIFHHVHSTYLDLNKRNYFIDRFLSRFTNKVICCSESVKRFVSEREGIPEDKLMVLYNGVPEPELLDTPDIATLKKELGIPEGFRVIGCVASLAPHKGHRYLLEAFKKIDNAYLLLIGDGSLRGELEKMASNYGISERVIFAGYKKDVTPYIQLMDIVVLPSSEREGLGISIIEAMALSKPVVATNIGGIPELVEDGRTGILVKPKDSDALTEAINRLLKSPELMRKLSVNGRKRYLKIFTLNQMIEKIEELYAGCR